MSERVLAMTRPGERRGVHAVVDHGDPVGVERLRRDRVRLAPRGHEQEVRRQRQVGARRDRLLPRAQPDPRRDHGGKARDEHLRVRDVGRGRDVAGVRDVERQRRAAMRRASMGGAPLAAASRTMAIAAGGSARSAAISAASAAASAPEGSRPVQAARRPAIERGLAGELVQFVAADD